MKRLHNKVLICPFQGVSACYYNNQNLERKKVAQVEYEPKKNAFKLPVAIRNFYQTA